MLNRDDNELICRVGAGTPMGSFLREFWIPCLLTSELSAPDGPPVRVRLLGEDLLAFRVTSGAIGLAPHNCPHRGASLFFGRNEEEGLRCVYHGWKFDVDGRCVDMPNEPAGSNFKEKIRLRSYKTVERNGVIWAYMGTREVPPPLPNIEPNMVPQSEVRYQKVLRECNWIQALEGDIDTSHLGFLHLGGIKPEDQKPGSFDFYTVNDRAPKYNAVETDYGTMYAAYRPAGEASYYWRFAQYLMPFFTMIPTGVLGKQVLVRAWVPLDDTHMMFWSFALPRTLSTGQGDPPVGDPAHSPVRQNQPPLFEYLPGTSDWLGQWRLTQHQGNDYLIDRHVQQQNRGLAGYTGISGIHQQDQALTESMGPIMDRTREHLGTSDTMVIRTRRRLINAVKEHRDLGVTPFPVDHPEVYEQRSGGAVLPREANWIDATRDLRRAFVEHADLTAHR
ncbi:MAG: Rieske 2Fe-2S domain-containing protein [Chloroflexota bacterium]